MKTLLHFLISNNKRNLRICLNSSKEVLINDLAVIELNREISQKELIEWCDYQSNRLGDIFPKILILENVFV